MKNRYLKELIKTVLSIKKSKELENFFEGIFTPQELLEIPVRLEIVKLLKKKTPQHTIAKKLGVGVATVTRGSRELKMGKFKYILNNSWQSSQSGG